MNTIFGLFNVEQYGSTLVVTPQSDLGELEFEQISAGMKEVLGQLAQTSIKNVILDFHKTSYFGSTALGFFVRLWKTISNRQGKMVLCNLSEHERDILTVTKLETLWDLCRTRADALALIRG